MRYPLQFEPGVGLAINGDELDAVLGLRATSPHVVDGDVALPAGVALHPQVIGGRTVITQRAVEHQRAVIDGEIPPHDQLVAHAARAEQQRAAVAQTEFIDLRLAPGVPAAPVQRHVQL